MVNKSSVLCTRYIQHVHLHNNISNISFPSLFLSQSLHKILRIKIFWICCMDGLIINVCMPHFYLIIFFWREVQGGESVMESYFKTKGFVFVFKITSVFKVTVALYTVGEWENEFMYFNRKRKQKTEKRLILTIQYNCDYIFHLIWSISRTAFSQFMS